MLMLMLIPMLMLMLMLFAASQWKEMSSHTHTSKHAIMSVVDTPLVVVVDTPLVVAVVVDAAPDVLSQRALNNLYVLQQRFIIVLCG